MAYPTTLDSLTRVVAGTTNGVSSKQSEVPHSTLHNDQSDAIEALQAFVGVSGSAVVTSVEYRLNALDTANSADVTLAGSYDYLTIAGQVITLAQIDLATDVTGNIPDASVPESAVTQHEAALSITESQISDLGSYLVAADIGVSVQAYDAELAAIAALAVTDGNIIVGNGSTWVAESGATARASLGVDAAGTDNSTNVTLAGSLDYLTLSGQEITLGAIDLATDVTGDLPVTEGGTGASDPSTARTNLAAASRAYSFVEAAVTENAMPADLNNALMGGWYYAFSGTRTNGPTTPTGGSVDWLLRVFRYSGVYTYQFLYAMTTSGALYSWTRYNNNGSWSSWVLNVNPNVSAIAGLTSAADKVPYFTGSGTAALADLPSFGRTLIANTSAADARTDLGLVIGTDVQAYGATLTSLEGLSLVSGDILYATAADTLARLAKGSDGQVLTLASGLPSWAAGGSGAWELQEQIDASAVAAVDIDIDAGYDHYWVMVYLTPADDNVQPLLRTGTSGGIDSGASDYTRGRIQYNAGGSVSGVGSTGDTNIAMANNAGNVSTEGGWFLIYMRPTDGTRYTLIHGTSSIFSNTGVYTLATFGGARLGTTAVETLRLLFSSGNIAIAKGAVYRAVGG